jgi:release factor glutamine methyltransferase
LTLRTALQQAVELLARLGRDAPRLSAELLLADAMGMSRLELLLGLDEPITEEDGLRIFERVRRRARGEPLACIRGIKEFYGRDFFVSSDVLIPRPESECLVDLALSLFGPEEGFRFADLGTGSGCLGISLACERPFALGVGTDTSWPAVRVARRNALRHGLGGRFDVTLAPLGSCLKSGFFEAVLSNPPYLSEAEMASLSPEIRCFEPRQALFGGGDGLQVSLQVLASASRLLKPRGVLLMETGPAQVNGLLEAARASGFCQELRIHRDLAGKERVLLARRCGL